jgi:glycosyltransferase involved in cell wall biosynthesis
VTPYDTYSDVFLSKGWFLKQLMRVVMWRANVLSCVSKDMVKQYATIFKKSPHVCIYNIVDDKASRKKMLEPLDHPWFSKKDCPIIVAAGRLAPWKGFENLIRIFPSVLKELEIKLMILGDGPLKGVLEKQIQDLDLSNNVSLLGYQDNPYPYYALADIFVLSSIVEGLPNVLVEAMMCGCTPVSTDCPTGPREVLNNGKYGYLVPLDNDNAFAETIVKAVHFPILHSDLQEAIKPFEESTVIDHHLNSLGYSQ